MEWYAKTWLTTWKRQMSEQIKKVALYGLHFPNLFFSWPEAECWALVAKLPSGCGWLCKSARELMKPFRLSLSFHLFIWHIQCNFQVIQNLIQVSSEWADGQKCALKVAFLKTSLGFEVAHHTITTAELPLLSIHLDLMRNLYKLTMAMYHFISLVL